MSIASYFRPTESDTLSSIHQATLEILTQTGIVFQSEEALSIFKQHNARVEGQTVFFTEKMVEDAIESAPSSFVWAARNTENSIVVGDGQQGIHVSLNNGTIYIQDMENGRRPGTMRDLINLYKLAQHSDICSIVGQIPVDPSDVAPEFRYLDIFRQLLAHSDKPLFGYVGTQNEIEQMFDLMKISLGSPLDDDSVFDQYRISVSLNPLSPLTYDEIPCETIIAFARRKQPVMILTCAMAGVTSPVDPMGTVVLQNAEILAGLVLTQLINKGTPVIYCPASAIPNMRSAGYMTGSPVSNLINITGVQLARELYHIPTRCMAGLTDAKIPDFQAGLETMQNYLMLCMGGVHMVNECFGILDAIMTVSYEKFILDEEIMSRAACIMDGIKGFESNFSTGVIKELGHTGGYLMHPSTMKHCRSFWTPDLSSCEGYDEWDQKGERDLMKKANAKFKQILDQCPEKILENDLDLEIETYIDDIKKGG